MPPGNGSVAKLCPQPCQDMILAGLASERSTVVDSKGSRWATEAPRPGKSARCVAAPHAPVGVSLRFDVVKILSSHDPSDGGPPVPWPLAPIGED